MIEKLAQTERAEALFQGWQETMIWSCLEQTMGEIYVDSVKKPRTAAAVIADFCFFAGEPEKEFLLTRPGWQERNFIIMVPKNEAWAGLIETTCGDKVKKITRYAMKKEEKIFDVKKLEHIVSRLDSAYALRLMDEESFWTCKEQAWSQDLVSQFDDYKSYLRLGIGAVILKSGKIVSGASSYTSYQGGIEIEIDTQSEYRRRGLASVCGARLILECLKKGLYPSWDAQNKASVALAEKLGYHYSHDYTAFEAEGWKLAGQ